VILEIIFARLWATIFVVAQKHLTTKGGKLEEFELRNFRGARKLPEGSPQRRGT
jgi:hypothetical protein